MLLFKLFMNLDLLNDCYNLINETIYEKEDSHTYDNTMNISIKKIENINNIKFQDATRLNTQDDSFIQNSKFEKLYYINAKSQREGRSSKKYNPNNSFSKYIIIKINLYP